MLRATQILPHTRYSETEARTYVSLGAHARNVMSFKLTPASTLEITLSQFWSSLGEGDLKVEVAFHGVAVVQGTGIIAGPSRTAKVQIRCDCSQGWCIHGACVEVARMLSSSLACCSYTYKFPLTLAPRLESFVPPLCSFAQIHSFTPPLPNFRGTYLPSLIVFLPRLCACVVTPPT